MDSHPSRTSPAFTTSRLQLLAGTIAAVRSAALDGHEPEKGDNAWTFGCRAYCRTCFAFSALADIAEHPWLQVKVEGLSCTLFIEGEPIKFYRGEADRPSERSLRRGLEEAILQGKLAFYEDELASSDDDWFWLMAIETHDDGTVLRVAIFQANQTRETRNLWFIPLEGDVTVAASVTSIAREGVDLLPPDVGPKTPAERAAANEDSGGGDGTD